ncbi:hypothetical protein CAPTEDRAFT_200719 [Capitella teleta]|uniref:Uncharacterized protein n=1 Tax=Capitella teleta TaxID=283909 RepID=R7UZ65_CAPTE|nr:hypothetical protein CAPTEDRAFT_200719 [Capitella teleta]|eukprot:ELU09242.1 hypothetical protein CAPTEDRAFT_200719 [Capitella teleta]
MWVNIGVKRSTVSFRTDDGISSAPGAQFFNSLMMFLISVSFVGLENIVERVLKSKAIVHFIAITQQASSDMDQLSFDTGGQSYSFNPNNTEFLNAKFKNIAKSAEDSCDIEMASNVDSGPVKIIGGNPKLKKAFILDASLGRDLLIIFQFESNDFLIEISSPNGNWYNRRSYEFSCRIEFMACHFLLGRAEPGEWTIEFSTSGKTQAITYTVEAKAADRSIKPIEAELLWNTKEPQNISSTSGQPQKLYAKVKQGNSPILDASASVKGSGSTTANKNGIVGFGEIFGANNPDASKKTGNFCRTQTSQSIQVVHYRPDPSGKLYPPARISDLKVTWVDRSNFTATLEWTAVGEQASIGQASEYQLRYGMNSYDIIKNFTNLPLITNAMIINGANLRSPQTAGAREVFQVMLPRDKEYYVIGIVAIDRKNRFSTSTVSNFAHISFTIIPDTPKVGMNPFIIGCVYCVCVVLVILAIWAYIKCRRTNEILP